VFQGDDLVAAMALVGTSASIDTEPDAAMGRLLRETAAALSTELGFVHFSTSQGAANDR
jgi:DNA-binding IclR family transcriptional regulator